MSPCESVINLHHAHHRVINFHHAHHRVTQVTRPVADAVLAVLRRHTLAKDGVAEPGVGCRRRGTSGRLWQQLSLSQPETAETEDAELCLESHTRLADLVTDASWLLFQLLQLNAEPYWNDPLVHGRMMTDTERLETSCVISM